jgi:hypothetical protein
MVVASVVGKETNWLVDTGATISVVRSEVSDKTVVRNTVLAKGVTGHNLNIVGSQELTLEFENGLELSHSFKVCPVKMGTGEIHGILGLDFLVKIGPM